MIPHLFVYLILMPTRTRKRTSSTKKPVVKKEVVVVSSSVTEESIEKCIKSPTRTLKPVAKYVKPASKKVTETPVKEEVKVIDWKEKVQKLDGFSIAILPFLYLEWGTKELLKVTGIL